MDGWTHVGQVATYALLGRLQAEGFTWVSLEAGGTANPHHDVLISKLL
jgi:tyrosyl-tRNA synthetase